MSSHIAYSQFIPCNIVNLVVNFPDTVPAGQSVTIATTVSGSCDLSMSYVIRVDFVDGRSSKVLSTVSLPYYPVTSSFTTYPLINTAIAPTNLGNWVVQVQVYIISGLNGQTVTSSARQFTITVVPYTPTSVTTQAITTSYTTSLSSTSTSSNSTAEMIASVSSTPFSTTSSVSNVPSTAVLPAAIIAVVIAILAILMIQRRKNAPKEKPEVKRNGNFCGHCGKELQGNGDFCTHCGAKQT